MSTRLIDSDSTIRTKPMRLLVLGISRTGTSSLCIALKKLGYQTYHMNENLKRPTRFFPLWIEALKAKFSGEGKPYRKEEFDKLLGDYDAVSDLPAALFASELITAYPTAKVILTTRSPEKWLASMRSTIYLVHSWSSWDWLAPYDTLIGLWRHCDTRDWDAFLGVSNPGRRDFLSVSYGEEAKRRYMEHYQMVKELVPKERLLEFEPGDGWGPLCRFLGCEIPNGQEYPKVWDKGELIKGGTILWWVGFVKMLAQTVMPVAGIVGVGIYWQWWRL